MSCLDCLKGNQRYVVPMRVIGIILMLLSIGEIIAGSIAYSFLRTNHIGAFWGGISTIFLSLIAMYSANRAVVWLGLIVSMPSGLISMVAFCRDGYHANIILDSGCYQSDTGYTWGTERNIEKAYVCPYDIMADCICSSFSNCFAFHLASGTDCGTLYTTYYHELVASTVLNTAITILCALYFFLTLLNVSNIDISKQSPSASTVVPMGVNAQMPVYSSSVPNQYVIPAHQPFQANYGIPPAGYAPYAPNGPNSPYNPNAPYYPHVTAPTGPAPPVATYTLVPHEHHGSYKGTTAQPVYSLQQQLPQPVLVVQAEVVQDEY